MNTAVIPYIIIYMVSVFVASVSQVMLKKAAMKKHDNFLAEYLNPLVIFAYLLFFGTTLASVIAYKVLPISLGPVLEATSYLYVTLFGVAIFKERINRRKLLALLLIIIGIVVFAVFG